MACLCCCLRFGNVAPKAHAYNTLDNLFYYPSVSIARYRFSYLLNSQFLGQGLCSAISGTEPMKCSESPAGNVMALTLFVSLINIPGIIVTLLARTQLLTLIKLAAEVKVSTVSRIEKVVNITIRIGVIIFGIFVAAR